MELKERITCCHTVRVLEKNGISTMEELVRLTREDLLSLRGVGPVTAGDLEKAVQDWKRDNQEGTA